MSAHTRSFCLFSLLAKLASLVTVPSVLSLGVLILTAIPGLMQVANAQTPTAVPVLTWRYDLTHSGANTQETALTPANVASNAFGKLFALPVDDHVFAQPLYVPNLKMSDGQVHNVLFVATENDSVYAFDADVKGNPIWQVSLLTAAHGAGAGAAPVPQADVKPSQDIGPNIGITGTPAINSATNTMYVVSNTKESGQYFSRLHAINITTGAEQSGSPVTITATVSGNGHGSVGGQLAFDPLWTNQRPGLDYYNGYVYIAYSSHGDANNYHGWLFAYNATTLQQTAAICLSPDDQGASVWGSGAALPIDTSTGKMFVVTANGNRTTPFQATSDYGQSVVAFNLANGQLTPTDEWTTYNWQALNGPDVDLGSGGLLMLPDQPGSYPHLVLAAGKEGRISLLNRDSLGGLASGSNSNAVQDFTVNGIPSGQGFWGTAAYWNGNVYDWAGGDDGGTPNVGMHFTMNNGVLNTTPVNETTFTSGFPGPTFSVSSNGTQDGIVWAVKFDQFNSGGPAVLYAFDPDDLSNVLYESDTKSSDSAGPANKFSVAVVTNGKVYVAAKGEVDVYGLLNAQQTAAAPVITPDGGTFSSTQSVTMSSATAGASIYYTLDGTTPTASSTQYTGAISIGTDTTVNAIAAAAGFASSSVTSATFTFSNQTPPVSFTPAGGTYVSAQAVTITETDANAKVYYTTDGSAPSASSTPYTGPIQVAASETIKAVAIDPALANSNIGTAAYVIQSGGTSINFPTFASTQGLTLNGSAVATNSQLDLTTGGAAQAGSVFWNVPINIQAFTTNFEFQIDNGQADGFTFAIQNVAPTALGGDSAGLAYQDIQKSIAVKFNFYNYNGEGSDSTGLYTGGLPPVTPTVDISPSGIELNSGDPIQAQIVYDGTTLTLSLHDTVNGDNFTTSWPINIPQAVGGNAAYVGFTGATGGLTATQALLSWTYATQAVPPAFAPPAGTYSGTQNVSLSSQTSDASIYYTTDGSAPSASSTLYSAPIAVSTSETIKAVAISKTMGTSNVAGAAYVIQAGTSGNPSYSLSGTQVSINAPGASATSTITVTPSSGFTGSVTLACSVSGSPNAADAPTCVVTQPPAITSAQAVNGTINVVTQSGTTPGNYTMNVTGAWGNSTESTHVDIVVSSPGQPSAFALSSSSITIGSAGANATSTITVTPSGGFTGSVALACAVTGSPAKSVNPPTCSVTQPPVINGVQAVTATLTIKTTAASSASLHNPFVVFGGGSTLAVLFLVFLPRRRRNWLAMVCLLLFVAATAGISGCASTGGKIAEQNQGTTAGAYTVTVTGVSGSLTETTTIQVTVQ